MKRSRLIVAALCVFLGACQGAMAATGREDQSLATPAVQTKQEKGPIGAISFGYLYLGAQATTGQWSWHQHGFYGIPQVNVLPWLGFIGDFVSTYNTGANAHEHIQAYLGGPIVTAYSKKKLSPFGFATAGKTRDSKAGTITYSPTWAAGGGVTYKLNQHVALLFVPGEYVRGYPANGAPLNNFTSRFGIVLPITK